MIEIRYRGEAFDLPENIALEVEELSPIFNGRGTQSWGTTLPLTFKNRRLLNFPERPDSVLGGAAELLDVEVVYSGGSRSGKMNITEVSTEGVAFSIGFDNAAFYAEWLAKPLREVMGTRKVNLGGSWPKKTCEELLANGTNWNPNNCNVGEKLAVFPISVEKEDPGTCKAYLFNTPGAIVDTVPILIDDKEVYFKAYGYGWTPFVRAWHLLEVIFEAAGLTVDVAEHSKYSMMFMRLVVLNNTADACVVPELSYADLMPDCTVGEYLNALWVRFGLVYEVDWERKKAHFRLLRDILNEAPQEELSKYITDPGRITFESRQLRLSAGTSLNGAKTSYRRLEDIATEFTLGGEVSVLFNMENPTGDERNVGTPMHGGNLNAHPIFDNYVAKPDTMASYDYDYNDRFGRRREETGGATSISTPARMSGPKARFALEAVTGRWSLYDVDNKSILEPQSSFFDWDPSTPNVEKVDLVSADECVPVLPAKSFSTLIRSEFIPVFGVGPRHLHTYIKEKHEKEEQPKCPLAFMLAFREGSGKTRGRLTPENDEGIVAYDRDFEQHDGPVEQFNLFFQYRDGLFNTFWRRYDELLRHAMQTMEAEAVMSCPEAEEMKLLSPQLIHGTTCLINSVSRDLAQSGRAGHTLSLRLIEPRGIYDIKAEQGVPDTCIAKRHLAWAQLPNLANWETPKEPLGYLSVERWEQATEERPSLAYELRRDYWEANPTLPRGKYESGWWEAQEAGALHRYYILIELKEVIPAMPPEELVEAYELTPGACIEATNWGEVVYEVYLDKYRLLRPTQNPEIDLSNMQHAGKSLMATLSKMIKFNVKVVAVLRNG